MTLFKVLSAVIGVLSITACQSRIPYADDIAPGRRYSEIAARQSGQQQFVVYDPAEGVNKHIYKFNAKLDDYVLLPVVKGYKAVTPEFVRNRVTNFFMNVGEIPNFTNSVLQASPKKVAITTGRFVVNTTIGLLGTFDVATKMGLERQSEDFGQTLGKWGSGPGPYLVIPVIGPTNLRDVTGKVFDLATLSLLVPNDVEDDLSYQLVAYGLSPVNARYNNSFRYFRSGSPFEYELVRYINTQSRKLQIEK